MMMNVFVCVVPQLHVNILMLVQCQKPFFLAIYICFFSSSWDHKSPVVFSQRKGIVLCPSGNEDRVHDSLEMFGECFHALIFQGL